MWLQDRPVLALSVLQAVGTPTGSDAVSRTCHVSSSTAFFYDHFLAPSWLETQAKQMVSAEENPLQTWHSRLRVSLVVDFTHQIPYIHLLKQRTHHLFAQIFNLTPMKYFRAVYRDFWWPEKPTKGKFQDMDCIISQFLSNNPKRIWIHHVTGRLGPRPNLEKGKLDIPHKSDKWKVNYPHSGSHCIIPKCGLIRHSRV